MIVDRGDFFSLKINPCWAVLLLCLLLSACGEPLVLEEATPLGAERAALESIPGYPQGSYEYQLIERVGLKAEQGGMIDLRVWYPFSEEPAPVIIFSHGNWSDKDRYDNILSHWASYGFVVIAGTHLDGKNMARGIFNALRHGNDGLIAQRVADINYLLDHIEELQELLPLRLDANRVAVAGHSFGAFTAQQFSGARAITEKGDISADDRRVNAVVALSPPGPMFDEITAESWTQMHGPVLMSTGTHDVNAQFWPDWRDHKMSFDTAPDGHQYALVVQGADHYLGNLICRPDRDAEPQHDALNVVNAVSTLFLLAYVNGDLQAMEWLDQLELSATSGGFAELHTH
ncbi:Uncharacterised protein [Zhongshania aliphaticivorans]|uniref:Uncharacterized protein n=1 Tax=Zhongshania aliphaticivorans TaxID=1470434 RepID=A0A5S9MV83_9GAMM|nr:hypothetical protein [Zhongshania aliphaticivorans]CAA0081360.1 Uncharacterised protein [Zhongshania aliphaticivorans]CAA0084943.1 Uncharacterised protein [Zhongshania aliphaticivorans]